MTFIETVAEDGTTGATAELYAAERAAFGFLPNFVRAFSLEAGGLLRLEAAERRGQGRHGPSALRASHARRRQPAALELLHAGPRIGADRRGFLEPDAVRAAVSDHRSAGLDEAEVAVMDLAAKVATDATSVEQADIDRLRSLGLSDQDILDVVLAAAVRCFFSKVLDALGAEPDAKYAQLDPALSASAAYAAKRSARPSGRSRLSTVSMTRGSVTRLRSNSPGV